MKTEFMRYMKYAGALVFIESISGGENCFQNITWPNLYLMIPRMKVNFGEYLGSG
jgi:hypothetical protein